MKLKLVVVLFLLGLNGFAQGTNDCPPLYAQSDVVYINTSGQIVWPTLGSYSVLSNDYKYNCTNSITQSPVVVSGTGQNAVFSVITPSGNSGAVNFVPSNGNIATNGLFTTGSTYLLQYQICDITNTSICVTQNVNVYVTNTPPPLPLTVTTTHNPTAKLIKKVTKLNATAQLINFPDVVLKQKLVECSNCLNVELNNGVVLDANGDGEIDTDEALTLGQINLSGYNISDLTGLIYFSNLKNLFIANTQVSNIVNGSLPSSLEKFTPYNIPITSLDTSYYPNLIQLACMNTQIGTLDLGSNHNLQVLAVQNMPNLTQLNIKNTSSLNYNDTLMTGYCWTGCPNLTSICADSNEIAALQSYLASCGISTAGIDINSSCALAVDSNELATGVTVSPNPSSGVFTLSFSKPIDDGAVKVYNVLGQEVMRFLVPRNDKMMLDLSGLANGIYLVKLRGDGSDMSVKVIKQ